MNNDNMELDLREIWFLIKKSLIWIVLSAVVCAAGAFSVSRFLIAPQFEASVTLAVNTRDEVATHIANDQILAARQLVNTYAVVLTNDSLLDDIIRELNLSDTVTSLSNRLSADSVNNTQVMRITMRDRDPNTAQDVLEIIIARAEELLVTTVRAGSVEIVSPPRINFDPVSPRVGMNTVIGAGLGMFIAVAVVFIRRALKNTFLTDEDVAAHLGLPIIGVVPSLSGKEHRYG